MKSTHTAELPIPLLPLAARMAHIVPELRSHSLVSIGTLCDAGCEVIFTTTTVVVRYNNCVVMNGTRNPPGLWQFIIPVSPTATTTIEPDAAALTTIGYPQAAELVAYSHAALFSPALSTLEKALQRGYVRNIPGLTAKTLRRHPPRSVATAKGHLDQTRKNARSTKVKPVVPTTSDPPPDHPTSTDNDDFPEHAEKTHDCYVAVHSLDEPTGRVYVDQTGKFPCTSASGNNYIMVLYDYDSNAILMEPIRNRKGPTLVDAHQRLHRRLTHAGLRPRFMMLDNECSNALKQFLTDEMVAFQLTPGGIHRRNTAERAIRTAKNHIIAGLCTVHPKFPLYLWDKLIPQAELTLNMLRGSRMNPKLSAWDQVCGVFDFNRTPLGPPGTRVLVHEKSQARGTWAPHGEDAWYIGPAFEHYRCYKIWAWETRRERETDTLTWFPHQLTMPTPSALDRISASINDLATALGNPTPNSPLPPLETSQVAALKELVRLFSTQQEAEPASANSDTVTDDMAPLDGTAPLDDDSPSADAPCLRVANVPGGGAVTGPHVPRGHQTQDAHENVQRRQLATIARTNGNIHGRHSKHAIPRTRGSRHAYHLRHAQHTTSRAHAARGSYRSGVSARPTQTPKATHGFPNTCPRDHTNGLTAQQPQTPQTTQTPSSHRHGRQCHRRSSRGGMV